MTDVLNEFGLRRYIVVKIENKSYILKFRVNLGILFRYDQLCVSNINFCICEMEIVRGDVKVEQFDGYHF